MNSPTLVARRCPNYRPRQLELRLIGIDQDRRPEKKGHETAESEYYSRRERLGDQEGDAKKHEREAGVVNWQRVQRVKAQARGKTLRLRQVQ